MAPEKAFGFQRDTKSLLTNGSMQFDAITSRVLSAIYSRRARAEPPIGKSPVDIDDVPLHGFHGLDDPGICERGNPARSPFGTVSSADSDSARKSWPARRTPTILSGLRRTSINVAFDHFVSCVLCYTRRVGKPRATRGAQDFQAGILSNLLSVFQSDRRETSGQYGWNRQVGRNLSSLFCVK